SRGSGRPSPGPTPSHHPRGGSAAAIAINAALSQLGKPYVWGAAGPDSYDCSGLMLWSYAQAGVYLPHFSGYQYTSGAHVSIGSLIPGDLVFWSYNGSPSGIHHVAMYIGGGSIIEAPTEGIPVHVRSLYYGGLLPLGTRPY
ncbi:MAG: NlpC/P60 family protein, partial [Mycobacteriales bacterium]